MQNIDLINTVFNQIHSITSAVPAIRDVHIGSGSTRSAKNTSKYQPYRDATISLADLHNIDFPPVEHIFGGWLNEHSTTLLHGEAGCGKSRVSLSIASCVAGDGRFAGWKSNGARKVLYIDGEMGLQQLLNTIDGLSPTLNVDDNLLKQNLNVLSTIDVESEEDIFDISSSFVKNEIIRQVRDNGYELVVFDNVRTLSKMIDENSAASWSPINDMLKTIRKNASVLLIHHNNKSNSFSGSGNAITVVDNQLSLSKANPTHQLIDCEFATSISFEKVRSLKADAHEARTIGLHQSDGWKVRFNDDFLFQTLSKEAETFKYTTQKQLAHACGIEESKLSRIISGTTEGSSIKEAIGTAKNLQQLKNEEESKKLDTDNLDDIKNIFGIHDI